jgi:uncharacterized protein (DUF1800 family)
MTATQKNLPATLAANRFGLGARPGELDVIAKDPRRWLSRQLEGRPPVLSDPALKPAAQTLRQALELRQELVEARRERKAEATQEKVVAAALKLPSIYGPVYLDEVYARFTHAVTTDRPFLERLTQFWSNHFAVSVDKVVVLGLAGALEREAIRPHVTGKFSDLLLAVERHPAMILYLDNQASIGANSRAAQLAARRGNGERRIGINENLAREILELHTLGVDGGYTQADVTSLAQAISGWSIGGDAQGRRFARLGGDGGKPGEFHFREAFHEPGAKQVLGKSYRDGGVRQGVDILQDLAVRPETARHVCGKLARHFVADQPPPALVARLTQAWLDSRGALGRVYEVLIGSPEAWAAPLSKFKTPADYLYSSHRALGLPVRDKRRAAQAFEALGQRSFMPGSPAGWPDTSADWDGSSALLKRIAWADTVGQRVGDRQAARELAPEVLGDTLSAETAQAIARAESGAQAMTLLLASPEFMRR